MGSPLQPVGNIGLTIRAGSPNAPQPNEGDSKENSSATPNVGGKEEGPFCYDQVSARGRKGRRWGWGPSGSSCKRSPLILFFPNRSCRRSSMTFSLM